MITVVGEALVDLVIPTGKSLDDARPYPGGSPANVALALARLEQPATLVTTLGADEYGQLIRDHLLASGVILAPGSETGHPTSRAVARLDERGGATYEFEIVWDVADIALPPGTVALHTGSLATALQPGREAVLRLLRDAAGSGQVLLSYDPNVRPALLRDREEAIRDIEEVAALAHVIKVSHEDLEYLHPGQPDAEIARRWLTGGTGVAMVVVTRGENGVYGATQQAEVTVPATQVKLVDTVGAGDAFTAGLLDALDRADLLDVGRIGVLRRLGERELGGLLYDAGLVSAVTVSRPGADPPRRAELDAFRMATRTP
jgi:fructokinase